MAKVIFDEQFYFCDNLDYFKEAIKFVEMYLEAETLFFYSENHLNSTFNNMKVIIDGKISSISNVNMINIDEIPSSNNQIEELYILKLSDQYEKMINHFHLNDDIIFISVENLKESAVKKIENIFIFNHIYKEIGSCFAEFSSKKIYVKNILSPQKNKPLPNSNLCKSYKNRQDELSVGKDIKELQALYYSIGVEIVKRNGYCIDTHVSSLNPDIYGKIYSFNISKEIYSSIDIEHGAIEIFNHRGEHQDEYTYDGTPQNKKDKTGKHNIIV